MPLSKIGFAPGIDKEGTQYTADSGWFDSDKIRFRKGRVEKIGGWQKYAVSAFKGVCRSILDWGTKDGDTFIGLGTNLKFYVENGSTYNDITPIAQTTTNAASFAATDGSSNIVVTDAGHGTTADSFVTFSGATGLGGNITADVLNQEYQVNTVIDSDSYNITAKNTGGATVTANSSDTGSGGGAVTAEYQINAGLNEFLRSTGWGVDAWGFGAWSSTTSLSVDNQLRLYSQDVFGDDLIFNPRGGGIYYWEKASGLNTRAIPLSSLATQNNPPAAALQVMVSDVDRHVICFGSSPIGSSSIDPLLVRWSDQENAGDWLPTATNSSGGQVLSTGTLIIGAVKTRQEIIISTDSGLTSMRFIGAPFIYSFTPVAENVSFASPKAAISAGDSVYFMDPNGFYVYRGAVQRLPCSVHRYVFENLNRDQIYKIFCLTNTDFSEVTWFYPVGSENTDVTNYVTFNYMENLWTVGTLERGAYTNSFTKEYPLAASNDTSNINENYLYYQEIGHDGDGSPITAYVESGGIGLGDGDSFMHINRIVPDFTFSGDAESAEINITIKGKDFPLNDASVLSSSVVTSSTNQSYVRARTREAIIRVESSSGGYGWTLGDLRFGMRTDGRR